MNRLYFSILFYTLTGVFSVNFAAFFGHSREAAPSSIGKITSKIHRPGVNIFLGTEPML